MDEQISAENRNLSKGWSQEEAYDLASSDVVLGFTRTEFAALRVAVDEAFNVGGQDLPDGVDQFTAYALWDRIVRNRGRA